MNRRPFSMKIVKEADIISFDIYDTCICRACGSPRNVFYLLAVEVLGGQADFCRILDFVRIRESGERAARSRVGRGEITVADIYALCDFSAVTEMPTDEIRNKEVELEFRQAVPIKEIRDLIYEYHKAGIKICYITDMYLPEEFFLDILQKYDFWQDGDNLFVSGAVGLTKSSGDLFRYIADCKHLTNARWIHYGDNVNSDVKIPRKQGIKPVRVSYDYTACEKSYLNHFGIKDNLSLLAGACRGIRLMCGNDVRYAMSSNLAAPVLVLYVYELMSDARRRGVERLFFLSRDGYLLYETALLLRNYFFSELEISYLYISRAALYLCNPEIKTADDAIELIAAHAAGKTIGDAVDALNEILPPDIVDCLADALSKSGAERFTEKQIVEVLKRDERILSRLSLHVESQQKFVFNYFLQEGLASATRTSAVVDLRGTGKCLHIINAILSANGCRKSFGYYLEKVAGEGSDMWLDEYFALVSPYDFNVGCGYFRDLHSVIEKYYGAAPHPRTVGYRCVDDKTVPIFDDADCSRECLETVGIHKTVLGYFVEFFCRNRLYLFANAYFNSCMQVLNRFAETPDIAFLDCLANFGAGAGRTDRHCLVKKINPLNYRKNKPLWFRGSLYYTLRFKPAVRSVDSLLNVCDAIKSFRFF